MLFRSFGPKYHAKWHSQVFLLLSSVLPRMDGHMNFRLLAALVFPDRKSVVKGKSVDLGGSGMIKKAISVVFTSTTSFNV